MSFQLFQTGDKVCYYGNQFPELRGRRLVVGGVYRDGSKRVDVHLDRPVTVTTVFYSVHARDLRPASLLAELRPQAGESPGALSNACRCISLLHGHENGCAYVAGNRGAA